MFVPRRFTAWDNATTSERFWAKVDKDGSMCDELGSKCWDWKARIDDWGYGRFNVDGRNTLAHRFAYEELKDKIPEGLEADHLCNRRCCVNPNHIQPTTTFLNGRRSNSFSAINARKTHCIRGHELAGENLYRMTNGGRCCKECVKEARRECPPIKWW